jgi:hypothetical protein
MYKDLHAAQKCGFHGTSVGQDNTPFLNDNQLTMRELDINPHARLTFNAKEE